VDIHFLKSSVNILLSQICQVLAPANHNALPLWSINHIHLHTICTLIIHLLSKYRTQRTQPSNNVLTTWLKGCFNKKAITTFCGEGCYNCSGPLLKVMSSSGCPDTIVTTLSNGPLNGGLMSTL